MIVTAKRQIPLSWILFASLPIMATVFAGSAMGTPFLFSLQKFVDNPAALTFILSLPGILGLITTPLINFLSDRIWTRFGRRKPFVVPGWVCQTVCLALIPLMPNLASLVALFIISNVTGGLMSPQDALNAEIVPPHQRGTAAGIGQWWGNLSNMAFYFVVLGRFDDVRFMGGLQLSGEKVIFWISALTFLIIVLFFSLGVKETDPKSPLAGQRLSLRTFFGGILDPDLWPIYTLTVPWAVLSAGLGPIGALLYTDQWAYSKQLMGTNVMIGGVINVFIIGFLTLIADRLNRLRAYVVLIIIALILNVLYYVYVMCLIPDRRPSLVELVVFGEALSIVTTLLTMIKGPLVYDYVVRNKLGTYAAGAGLVNTIVAVITVNSVGLFVWAYTGNFQPPAGEMTRVVFHQEWKKPEVAGFLAHASWTNPNTGAPLAGTALHAAPWYGTGLVTDSGNCWEIRFKDEDSVALAAEKAKLSDESFTLASSQQIHADAAPASRLAEIAARIREIDTTLDARSQRLKDQIASNFQDRILKDGEQIQEAGIRQALVVELPVNGRPSAADLEKILTDLREAHPEVIDLRPTRVGEGYGVALSALPEPENEDGKSAAALQSAFTDISARRAPKLARPDAAPPSYSRQAALVLKLMIVEEPLDNRITPITHVVNFLLSQFGLSPSTDHRMTAMARTLRLPGDTDHVRVTAPADNSKSLTIVAVLAPGVPAAAIPSDPVSARLQSLLAGAVIPDAAVRARTLYDRVITSAGAQRITVARPFIDAAYAPMKYNYLVGYLCTFLLVGLGLVSVFAFTRRARRGEIRMLGAEEEHAAIAARGAGESAAAGKTALYTPGYAKAKLAMVVFGLAVFVVGMTQLWSPLQLLVTGRPAPAEATRVIKAKTGIPDLVFTDDVRLRSGEELRDRTFTFWNEFRFQTETGSEVIVRAPVGSQLKPLYPIIDDDGLPTTVPILYDPRHPESVVFPTIFSTWYAPAALAFLGMLCAVIGVFLYARASRPIEIPNFPSQAESPNPVGSGLA
jgi:MFS family permease